MKVTTEYSCVDDDLVLDGEAYLCPSSHLFGNRVKRTANVSKGDNLILCSLVIQNYTKEIIFQKFEIL